MSRTLFWYIMRDLLRIFIMTSLVLAGIMSFGGLLQPLTKYGLSGTQVGQMLLYFMPATQTYSLPIAALFATTVVYGRLSADNELTACRAVGISHLWMGLPALLLGLVLSLGMLASVSFVVPAYTLKVEKVLYSSLADMVKKNIQRSHSIRPPGQPYTIFAESAEVLPPPADRPNDEVVELYSPMFCLYEQHNKINVPTEFFTARSATVVIHRGEDQVEIWAYLKDGVKFPRYFQGSSMGGLATAQFGPVPLQSPIKENTKFMNIRQLRELHADPLRGREIRTLFQQITQVEQETLFLNDVAKKLRAEREYVFDNGNGEVYRLKLEWNNPRARFSKSKVMLMSPGGVNRQVRLVRERNGVVVATDEARNVGLRAAADLESNRMRLEFDLEDVLVGTQEGRPGRRSFSRPFSVPVSAEVAAIEQRRPEYYLGTEAKHPDAQRLQRKLAVLRSEIVAEIHFRAALAVSCLILVMIGCALGMIFRTGNFLSAFALGVIPALLAIALAVTGQHVGDAEPKNLLMGIVVIWSGNALVLVLAVVLMGRLQRQ